MSQDLAATVAGLEWLREWTNHSGPAYLKAGFEKSLTAAIAMLREQETTVRSCAEIAYTCEVQDDRWRQDISAAILAAYKLEQK